MASHHPCSACSWTTERQENCSYESQVKIFYEAGDRAVWSVGSRLVLKDRGTSLPTFEAPNIRFIQENTSIPVPNIIDSWEERHHSFILMNRIPGESLDKAWPQLSTDEKESLAEQTAGYLSQLRTLQSDKIQALNGHPVYSDFLFRNSISTLPHGPLLSDHDLWAEMACDLKESVPNETRKKFRQYMPHAKPYTFTHSDLTNVNIMVENGRLTGIIDWETSGYFPVWWEYVCTSVAQSEEDKEWKTLLRKYMPHHSAAREFWLAYYHLYLDPNHERAVKYLHDMCPEETQDGA